MSDEFITPDKFVRSPRGRKTIWNEELIATLAKVTEKSGVILKSSVGPVAHDERPAVSAMIRKHWRRDRNDDVSISYSADGIPQIEVRKTKKR